VDNLLVHINEKLQKFQDQESQCQHELKYKEKLINMQNQSICENSQRINEEQIKKTETQTIISNIDDQMQILKSKKRENETIIKQCDEHIIQWQRQISQMNQIVKMRQHEIDENVIPVLNILSQQVKDLQLIQTEYQHIQSKHHEFLLKCKSKETFIKKNVLCWNRDQVLHFISMFCREYNVYPDMKEKINIGNEKW